MDGFWKWAGWGAIGAIAAVVLPLLIDWLQKRRQAKPAEDVLPYAPLPHIPGAKPASSDFTVKDFQEAQEKRIAEIR